MGVFRWICLPDRNMPIVEMICELKDEQIGCENIWKVIQRATDLISRAEKYRGVPYPSYPRANVKAKISVSFKVIFKNMEDLGHFIRSL